MVCYRTGLNIGLGSDDSSSVERGIVATVSSWKEKVEGSDILRLANKALNDFVVRTALSIATEFNKPGEYHLHILIPCHHTTKSFESSSIPHWSRRSRSHSHAVLSNPHATNHRGVPQRNIYPASRQLPLQPRCGLPRIRIQECLC